MKIRKNDVVILKSKLLRVRRIDKDGVWVGGRDPIWQSCYKSKSLIVVYRRAPKKSSQWDNVSPIRAPKKGRKP